VTLFVLAGPTAAELEVPLEDCVLLPPARSGAIHALTSEHSPRGNAIAFVDGLFGDVPPVGHRELLHALGHDWTIWGLSSMGALRAFELRDHGMRGHGDIYARMCRDPWFADDELALLHEPSSPYRALSEPLVNLRALLDVAVQRGAVSPEAAEHVQHRLADLWFGDRTTRLVRRLVGDQPRCDAAAFEALLRDRHAWDRKRADLERFLTTRPWKSSS
jgi:hypothetical protein